MAFTKNAGLYGERVGALHIVLQNKDAAAPQVLYVWSANEPRIQISLILTNDDLFNEWIPDIKTMGGRLVAMRKKLYRLLTEELPMRGNWEHASSDTGTRLSPFDNLGIREHGITEIKPLSF
ncbi:hypothetical protein BJ138DRAFT_1102937 [Hygrophoropsis aurantiaca]|uniref:Uncharacterized protein n=1 Tax=Hygrophoropsis aurantiaca TaxID=72124 RepID=A0ACB8A6N9_9AGAM|nr:hypothetical protein BJ138DRAFT_1102937 [Hygrophoropsis aurantiaca]